ncbi:hypothetical protein BRADI_2g27135v3 [Brachypodium distachyon]|uniref:Uncharacterized protein n=1 Tax=Brachypodium distachyon TaxID=15368 RepID=A0A2K2DAU0_BRADI|nr:hypothetical protein BRADI_2g27135v3 [Brachypodium distachyon]
MHDIQWCSFTWLHITICLPRNISYVDPTGRAYPLTSALIRRWRLDRISLPCLLLPAQIRSRKHVLDIKKMLHETMTRQRNSRS